MRFRPDGLSPNAWAVKAGVSRTVWTDMRRHGNPSRRTLEKLLATAGSSIAEFEALRLGPEPRRSLGESDGILGDTRRAWTPAQLTPLPLVASMLAGEWGEPGSGVLVIEVRTREVVDRLLRPVSLAGDPDVFALTIVGDSMWPRFRPGSRIAVSPRAPVAIGDDVLVRLRNRNVGRVLIMQLAKRTMATFGLRQFNPDRTIDVDAADVEAVQKIVGELI
jgi:phage repressor protein C with HTH and peptisase S24 domain